MNLKQLLWLSSLSGIGSALLALFILFGYNMPYIEAVAYLVLCYGIIIVVVTCAYGAIVVCERLGED